MTLRIRDALFVQHALNPNTSKNSNYRKQKISHNQLVYLAHREMSLRQPLRNMIPSGVLIRTLPRCLTPIRQRDQALQPRGVYIRVWPDLRLGDLKPRITCGTLQVDRQIGRASIADHLWEQALEPLELLEQDPAARFVQGGELQDEVEDEEEIVDAEGGFLQRGGGDVDQDVGDGVCDFEELLDDGAAVDLDVLPGHAGDLLAEVLG